jgi:hypothetical protein
MVEAIEKKLFDSRPSEFAGRKADRVDDDQLDRRRERTFVAVGGSEVAQPGCETVGADFDGQNRAQLFASSSSLMPSRSMR